MHNIALALFVLILSASPARATPTPEQRSWFDNLSAEEAAAVLQAYSDSKRMERWDTVTQVAVTDLVRTKDVVRLNPTEVIPWDRLALLNDKTKVWWTVEMPRAAVTPFDVRVEWIHDGAVIQMKTFSVERPSPNYRLWDMITLKRRGVWTVRVLLGNAVLAQNRFTVD